MVMSPRVASQSNSSDYFEQYDSGFLDALDSTVLPGDERVQTPPPEQDYHSPRKRSHSNALGPTPPEPVYREIQPKQEKNETDDADIYGASRFGEFGEYMRRKRAKLQIQNAALPDNGSDTKSTIFKGVAIYINGWTQPSLQELRGLIIKHGGIFHAYLDKKSLVTHIITCSLTPAKIREFKNMKVVRPEWLVESVKADQLLPWKDFIFRPEERMEESQGGTSAQKTLHEGFESQTGQSDSNEQSLDTISDFTQAEITDIATGHRPRKAVNEKAPVGHLKKAPAAVQFPKPQDARTDEGSSKPKYAAHKSNPNAQRAMSNADWRSAHTSVSSDYIEGYYKNSRLHHLSTWKSELKDLVAEAQERAESLISASSEDLLLENINAEKQEPNVNAVADGVSMRGAELIMRSPSKGKGKAKAQEEERVMMHCDFDCFFVSAGLVNRPHLRGKPVAVCHSQGAQGGSASTSEIASCSYEAREYGIKNGMSLQQARKLCPAIITIPYEFELYKQFSLLFYTVLMGVADDLQAVSVDEALIDVTTSVSQIKALQRSTPTDPAKVVAERVRAQVKEATGCEVSIGIGPNILLARLATRRAKPAGSYHLLPSELPSLVKTLKIDDLHGFGWSARKKAEEKLGATNLGILSEKSKGVLCEALGKVMGETLYNAIRGIDERKLESDKPRKSVSCEINYGIRFENNEQAEVFVHQMAEEVGRRLDNVGMRGRSMTLKIMKRDPTAPVEPPKFLGHGKCDHFNKQATLVGPMGKATSEPKVIGECAWRLLKSFGFDPKELRGIGIQIQKLESLSGVVANVEPGQGLLPFKTRESPLKAQQVVGYPDLEPLVILHPPTPEDIPLVDAPLRQDDHHAAAGPSKLPITLDLPSFSQVDMDVFGALPEDVRTELETEYKRRSISPAVSIIESARSSVAPVDIRAGRISVKGTTKSKIPNVAHITRQLAPRNRPSVSPKKSTLFLNVKRPSKSGVKISDEELQKLDIDPEVFAVLPPKVKREQLAMARLKKRPGGLMIPSVVKHKVLKPLVPFRPIRSSSRIYRRPAPPKANHPPKPTLKQQGANPGEKLYFTETDDVQRVIESWVNNFQIYPPNQRDVDFFAKYLVRCVDNNNRQSTDGGLERAVMVMKWWVVLLRRYWGEWEFIFDGVGEVTGERVEKVGRGWWSAFRGVKEKMDVIVRKKFGGCLSLR